MNIEQKPRDTSTSLPDVTEYVPPQFVTTALQQTKNVVCSWDQNDYQRTQTLSTWKPAVDALKESDFSAYLAPDTDESDNEEESVSRRAQSLLSKALGVDLDNDDEEDEDVEEEGGEKMIKFVPNVERNMQRNRMEREREKEETVFEKYQREKRKKKRERQRQRKMNDGGVDEKVMNEDEEDPFAAWDRGDFDDKKEEDEEEVKEDDEDDEELKRRRKAELELLLVGSGAVVEKEETKKNKKRKKKGKKRRVRDDDEEKKAFDPNDNRFASVYDDPDFAIDRTHKRFKATPATEAIMDRRLDTKQKRTAEQRRKDKKRARKKKRREKKKKKRE